MNWRRSVIEYAMPYIAYFPSQKLEVTLVHFLYLSSKRVRLMKSLIFRTCTYADTVMNGPAKHPVPCEANKGYVVSSLTIAYSHGSQNSHTILLEHHTSLFCVRLNWPIFAFCTTASILLIEKFRVYRSSPTSFKSSLLIQCMRANGGNGTLNGKRLSGWRIRFFFC